MATILIGSFVFLPYLNRVPQKCSVSSELVRYCSSRNPGKPDKPALKVNKSVEPKSTFSLGTYTEYLYVSMRHQVPMQAFAMQTRCVVVKGSNRTRQDLRLMIGCQTSHFRIRPYLARFGDLNRSAAQRSMMQESQQPKQLIRTRTFASEILVVVRVSHDDGAYCGAAIMPDACYFVLLI